MFNIFNARQYPGNHFPDRTKKGSGAPAVGLLGGVEVRSVGAGPILCDHDYTVEWEIAGLGAQPAPPPRPAGLASLFCFRSCCQTAPHGPCVLLAPSSDARSTRAGESPKAENSWTRGTLRELDGTVVATSLVLNRSLKASSPLYAEEFPPKL